MKKLENRISIVTGGASGIGAATVREFVCEGARVVIADLNVDAGEALAAEIVAAGGQALFVRADMAVQADIEALAEAAVVWGGRIDVLVNNAGIGSLVPSHELAFSAWRQTLAVNLDGVFLMAQQAIRRMRESGGGSIVNVASVHGHVGFANHAAYTASKGAVVNLTRTLGIEYGKENIRVNAVCPGVIMTPIIEQSANPAFMKALTDLHPIGRIGRADEVARAIVFLASDDASFVTGSSLMVDGGYTAG